MSDERKQAKSRKVSTGRHAEVADRLGFRPGEIAVFSNPDGEYAVDRNGHRMLLQDGGAVAWYGEEAPNPTYPLVRPSVLIDESDAEEIDLPPADDPPAAGAKKPGPPPRPGAAKK